MSGQAEKKIFKENYRYFYGLECDHSMALADIRIGACAFTRKMREAMEKLKGTIDDSLLIYSFHATSLKLYAGR